MIKVFQRSAKIVIACFLLVSYGFAEEIDDTTVISGGGKENDLPIGITPENQLDQKTPENQLDQKTPEKQAEYKIGEIIAINKITANSKTIRLKTEAPKYFGNIEITLHKCIKNLDPYSPDDYMLVTIVEKKIDEDSAVIFRGWLLSSSISVSTFEHPVYEVFASQCVK